MSLVLLFHYLLLNMFRILIHPSSGACDLLWIYFMCCIALVRCVLVLRCGSAGVVWYPYACFFRNVFKRLGLFCSILVINLLFYLIVLLLLGLLCSIWSTVLLGFVLLGCMGLLLVGLRFMLVGLLYLLLLRILLGWLGRTVFLGTLICL